MTDHAAPAPPLASPLRPAYAALAIAALAVMVIAIVSHNRWLLTFIHVMAGVLWTGIDLFMGFVVGPVLRRVPLDARRAVIGRLVPRTLLLMPTLAIITGTTGWYLARQVGYLQLGYPEFWWVVAALAIITVLTVQGLGYLLPTNVRLYFAYQRPDIDTQTISQMMNSYVRVVAIQGVLQVAIIVVMAKFGSGL